MSTMSILRRWYYCYAPHYGPCFRFPFVRSLTEQYCRPHSSHLLSSKKELKLFFVTTITNASQKCPTCDITVVQLVGLKNQQFGRRRRWRRRCIIVAICYGMVKILVILLWHLLLLVLLLQYVTGFDRYRWQNHVWWFQYWSAVTWWRSFRWHTVKKKKRNSVMQSNHIEVDGNV